MALKKEKTKQKSRLSSRSKDIKDFRRSSFKIIFKRSNKNIQTPVICIHLFQFPKKSKDELRTTLYLKKLNKFIKKQKSRMLIFRKIALLITRGAWTVTTDLKDGFKLLKIHKRLQGVDFRMYLSKLT